MMKHVSETSEKQLGNGRIFTFGTVSIWYNPERSFRRSARILNNRSVITEQVFRKESRNTALSDDLIQPFSTKTRRYIDMLSTHKTITLALMCALASTTVLTGCKDGAQQGQAAHRQQGLEVPHAGGAPRRRNHGPQPMRLLHGAAPSFQ